jgi:hypothetical protein
VLCWSETLSYKGASSVPFFYVWVVFLCTSSCPKCFLAFSHSIKSSHKIYVSYIPYCHGSPRRVAELWLGHTSPHWIKQSCSMPRLLCGRLFSPTRKGFLVSAGIMGLQQ